MAEGGYDFENPEFDRDDFDDDGDIDDKVRKRANIRNRYNQAPHLTKDTNGKVKDSQFDCLIMTLSHLFNGSDWLQGVIGERHTGYANNRILPVGP